MYQPQIGSDRLLQELNAGSSRGRTSDNALDVTVA